MSESHKGQKPWNAGLGKKVMNVETGRVFDTQTAAAKWASVSVASLSKAVLGKTRYSGKDANGNPLHWKVVEITSDFWKRAEN